LPRQRRKGGSYTKKKVLTGKGEKNKHCQKGECGRGWSSAEEGNEQSKSGGSKMKKRAGQDKFPERNVGFCAPKRQAEDRNLRKQKRSD